MKVLQLMQNLNNEVITLFHDSINYSLTREGIAFDDLKVSIHIHEGSYLQIDCDITQEDTVKTYTVCAVKDNVLYALCNTSVYWKYYDENQSVIEIVDESSTIDDVVQRFIKYITHKNA